MELVYVISGLAVGFIVGMTGVGGGSLMTPILLFFGINPATAVGTDLLYAAITKAGGVLVHHKQRNIDWHLTGWLALGSLPAALLTLWVLHTWNPDVHTLNAIIKRSLGFALQRGRYALHAAQVANPHALGVKRARLAIKEFAKDAH